VSSGSIKGAGHARTPVRRMRERSINPGSRFLKVSEFLKPKCVSSGSEGSSDPSGRDDCREPGGVGREALNILRATFAVFPPIGKRGGGAATVKGLLFGSRMRRGPGSRVLGCGHGKLTRNHYRTTSYQVGPNNGIGRA